MKNQELIIVRGGGDMATAVIHRLWRAGFRILVLEAEHPAAIRRQVAISEAVTNAIVHGYEQREGIVYMEAFSYDCTVMFSIRDTGCGIEDIKKAREPLFTTKADEERSGLGFTVMESFMDSLHIESKKDEGTTVTMTKRIGSR